ncbi:MAG: DUF1351 domain-containing protein [Lachnospiraceae bacterium]|nr:DUF1351 domain-containing protein [Lachnospiraceae bacterium]
MELRITTQLETETLPEVEWNHEELKQEIVQKVAEYKNIAYTDEQASEMRKDRATLNKLVTAVEDRRKQVKKFYMAPYDKFEAQVKDVLSPVREAIGTIDAGLTEIERQYRVDKENRMREMYEAHVGDLGGIVPFEKTVKEENFKKAVTDKKLEQFYTDFFNRVNADIETLETVSERYRDNAKMKYSENFNLSEAINEAKRLEEIEKAWEERRQKMAAEKAEAEARKAAEAERMEQEAKAVQSEEVIKPKEEPAPAVTEKVEKPVVHIDFRVWGTREQIMDLRQYMIDNGLKFGKVE